MSREKMLDFMQDISHSEFVYFDDDNQLFFAWNGNQTVNVYNSNGHNVDAFSINNARESIDLNEEIEDYLQGRRENG